MTIKVEKSHPLNGSGETEPSNASLLPVHSHTVKVAFDGRARVVPTTTEEALGHVHPITKTTATDLNLDHAHRLIFEVS